MDKLRNKLKYIPHVSLIVSSIEMFVFTLNIVLYNNIDPCSKNILLWSIITYKIFASLILMLDNFYTNSIIISLNIISIIVFHNNVSCNFDTIDTILYYEIIINLIIITILYLIKQIKIICKQYDNYNRAIELL